MTTGGQSLPGGQAALVTPSGKVVGSASVPIYSSKYYGPSGRARSQAEQEFEAQQQKQAEAKRLLEAQQKANAERERRLREQQEAQEKARAERQSRGIRQEMKDDYTNLRRNVGESQQAYEARKEKLVRAVEVTTKQSVQREITPTPQNNVIIDVDKFGATEITKSPTLKEQYGQAIKKKGFVRGTIYFAGEKIQGQFGKAEEKYTPQSQSLARTGTVSTAVQVTPYFTPAGAAYAFAGAGEELVTPGGQRRLRERASVISEELKAPKPVGYAAAYGEEIALLGFGTYGITRKLDQPTTTVLDVQTKTTQAPSGTYINLDSKKVLRVPEESFIVESTVLSETKKGFFNPSRTKTSITARSLVSKEGKVIDVVSRGKGTGRTSYGQPDTIALDYISSKPRTIRTSTKGKFEEVVETKISKDYLGLVTGEEQAGAAGIKVFKTGETAISATTAPLVETGFGKVIRGQETRTAGFGITKKRANQIIQDIKTPKTTVSTELPPQISLSRTPEQEAFLTQAGKSRLTQQEAKSTALSTVSTTQTTPSNIVRTKVPVSKQQITPVQTSKVVQQEKTSYQLLSSPKQAQNIRLKTSLISKTAQKESSKSKNLQISASGNAQKVRTTTLQATQQKQKQKQKQKLISRARTLLAQARNTQRTIKPPVPVGISKPTSTTSKSTISKGSREKFDILYGVSKKERTSFTGTFEEAVKKAVTETRGSIKAGFAITKRGSAKPLPITKSISDFKPSKTTKGFLVQEKTKRLSQQGEISDILSARKGGKRKNPFGI